MSVRTRFAPSPTGYLHIGGARTALFNFLFARHHGGQYLLRIEDTDKQRSTPEAVRQIIESLDWLGLSPDEPPVFQSQREPRHAEVARELLARGRAYLAYDTPEELAAMRAAAEAAKRPFKYDGSRWIDLDPAQAPGVPPAIRIKAPRPGEGGGETVVKDLVQGEVRVANAELDDMIILRSDGTPTYLHAVVVDDHDMAITHVIRGDDHLTNTFRQCMVYDAMGWRRPHFAHIPLIHGADGAKLSKRHGAVGALDFREQGLLPEAVCNYLLRLGWGHGDTEIISREDAIRIFDIADVGRAASRMDYAKLAHFNGVYIRATDDARLAQEVLTRLAKRGISFGTLGAERVRALMPELKARAKDLEELAGAAVFAAQEGPPAMDQKAAAALTPEAKERLRDLAQFLTDAPWERLELERWLRDYAEVKGLKLGAVAQPLRAALTGSLQSPPIDAVLAALGRTEAMDRILAAAED
ncbi:glutamate--tRNA ligase [Siccirubricoccus sp. KC 17139]|uniref:Glutamate--tRNA ligase n=1 Tax=Siccirubricoccus soli TaxID=2899147 RepID=A0ABT1D705_9PROT|nr:glutamate--tRNA ligase [Siccirubricoccus soli]MCO6416775.1 glutamate--tRNA ligase [Siccirubricoccus soli]MCP2682910.1 glutamate--tRNA ligase [Siccirubricoccus soli]